MKTVAERLVARPAAAGGAAARFDTVFAGGAVLGTAGPGCDL